METATSSSRAPVADVPQPQRRPGSGGPAPSDIVVVPAHPVHGGGDIEFEVRQSADGMDVLPAFSSVRRLVAVFGQAQPWIALPLSTVKQLAGEAGVRQIMLDPMALPDAWRWSYADLVDLDHDLGG